MRKDPSQKQNIPTKIKPDRSTEAELERMKKLTRRQLLLAVGALLIIIVLLFAMTSAWINNVSKTEPITFKTEIWGIDPDKIIIPDTVTNAAPGTGGTVSFSVDNSDNVESVKLTVLISKNETMSEDLQKRIFFYADRQYVKNGETVSGKYIGSTNADAYDYTILPGHTLSISENVSNDVPVKWKWVYDMTGYYFRGKAQMSGNTVTGFTDVDYIRPIEYDFDKAIYDDNGALAMIDGVSRADFLTDISSHDGYQGTIDTDHGISLNSNSAMIYYPVDFNTETYEGVWAYLCTWAEIEQGIATDVTLSSTNPTFNARMTLAASNMAVTVQTASDAASLAAAAAAGTGIVSLSDDISIASMLTVSGDLVLDLNGHDITYSGSGTDYSMFYAPEGTSLSVVGGNIAGNGENGSSTAFYGASSEISLNGVNVSDVGYAVFVKDRSGADSVVTVNNCSFTTSQSSVMIYGNGSGDPLLLSITDTTINSGYVGVCGNGNSTSWNTQTVISHSNITGTWAAVYQPQGDSSTVIKDGSVCEGYTGIVVKGGAVTVTDSTVKGTGAYAAAAANSNGWTDTGDGIYVDASYDWNASVTVNGTSSVTSDHSYAVQLFGVSGRGTGSVLIESGTFGSGLGSANWNGIGSFRIKGGTFGGAISPNISDEI